MMQKKYVYLFSEGNATMRELLGGKGANLAEMTHIGIIRNQSGLNSFKISVKEFVARTNAVRQGASKPLHHTLFPVLIYILVP